ncbi:mediator of rna polymerase ii transcription subunit 14-like [Nannochloropsis oceanica]
MMVKLADLLHRVLDRAHEELHALVTRTLPGQDYEDRRTEITKYVHYTRRALVQLFVLLEWLSKQNDAMDTVMDGAIFLQSEAQQAQIALDRLFYMHRDLFRKQVATRPYDLATAIDVLALGTTFGRFPRELNLSRSTAVDKDGISELELNHAIHSSLIIREKVPAQYAYARVEEGTLQLVDADNFALSLMLEYPEPASAPWRLLDIQILLSPQGGNDRHGNNFHSLKPDLEQMKQLFSLVIPILENDSVPLLSTYKLCRSFCNALRLEMLALQAKELAKGTWQGHLHVDDSSLGRLEITMWKGVYLHAEQEFDGAAIAEVDANKNEDKKVGVKAVAEICGCILRLWLDEENGMRHLRATCSYCPASEGLLKKAEEVTFHLSVKRSHISASSLLLQAFRLLVPHRLQVVQDLLKQDAVLRSLAQRGSIQIIRLSSSLQLKVWGSHLGLDVDRKSGRFIVCAPSCSGAYPAGELGDLLREWQASLGDCSTDASFGFAIGLFHGIVRHLFLRHLEVLASTHYDLACDRRWNKLWSSNLKSNDKDKEQTGLALRAKASTFFVLNARSGLLKGERHTGLGALGEEWDFLEIELGDLGVGDPVPCAYLVMASLSRRSARVSPIRARLLLDVPIIDGATYESWLGQVLAKARESMEARLVLDAATTALDLPRVRGGCIQHVLKREWVMLELGESQGSKSTKEGRLTSLSVVRSTEHEWIWNVGLSALELSGLLPRSDDTTFTNNDKVLRIMHRCGGVAGVLEVTFAGGWDPLVHALKLAEVVTTVAQLSWMVASFPSDTRLGIVCTEHGASWKMNFAVH